MALLLYVLVTKTRVGMLVRAGASNREMAVAMGVNIRRLFTVVFALGAALCALAGAMLGPLLAVQVGMGENILILAFVVIVIGGIGSIRGAFVGALLVGLVDTMGRALLPIAFARMFSPQVASNLGPSISSILIYVLMAAVLFLRPQGLFPGARMRSLIVIGALACAFPLGHAGARPALLYELRHAHPDLRHGGGEPQPRAGLRRHGELRPRGLLRRRRLHRRHPGGRRRHEPRIAWPLAIAVAALAAL